MTQIEAWNAIFNLSAGNEWIPIPREISGVLGLDSRLGILGGTLCTRIGARGIIRAVERINNTVSRLANKLEVNK
jgi:hypothetical protein